MALSFVTVPSLGEISYISKDHGNGRYAQAYALFNIAFSGGFLIGPLWGGLVTESGGWKIMVISLAGLAISSLPPILLWTGGKFDWKKLYKLKQTDRKSPKREMHSDVT